MNIRELKLFRHLASTLHFGRTSQACNITPSGLSRTIQRLEGELGKKLFNRNQRSVTLTRAGESFLGYTDDVLLRWNKLLHELASDGTLRGELTLYCSVTAILSILPSILEHFSTMHPKVHINLQTGDAAMAIDKLKSGNADISVAALPDELPATLHFIKLIETPLIFIGPKHNTTAVMKEGAGVDWSSTPLILAEKGLSRTRAEAWFRSKDITPNIYSQVAGNEAIITLVGMGCGVGIIPELVLLSSPMKDRVQTINVSPPLQPFSVGVCTTQKNRDNPIVKAFWQIVESGQEKETI